MPDDADSAQEQQTNGESKLSYDQVMSAERAAFVNGTEDVKAPKGKSAPAKDVTDDDADLEDEDVETDDDADSADADEVADDDADEDDKADADEDEDSDLDEDDKPSKPDPEVAKRLEQVRRTDKRLREQRDQQFSARERQIAEREEQIKPRMAELERYERQKARGPVAVLEGLLADISEEDADVLSRRVYALTKAGKADPRAKAAAEHFSKERERDNELNSIKKKLEEQEAEKTKAAESAEIRHNIDVYVGKVAKIAGDKTPLSKMYLAADPVGAKAELEYVAASLSEKLGRVPDHKTVIIAFEKQQRSLLRRYGIDPKTHAPSTTTISAAKPTPKSGDKKTAAKPKPDVGDKPLSREDFARSKFD